MVGLIWMVQVVHYPLFARVGEGAFAGYEAGHTRRIGRLLIVPAAAEVAIAALLPFLPPEGVSWWLPVAAGALLAVIWVMTASVHAPLHGRLSAGYDETLVRRLVAANRWRTGLWSARGVLAAVMLVV